MDDEPALSLVTTPTWEWCEGMLDRRGRRIVDRAQHDGQSLPDLSDFATAGAILGLLDKHGALTDVVKMGAEWVVAVDLGGRIQGYASDTLGEAAAWAMLAVHDHSGTVVADA